ncbi:MAG: YfiR family protein [Opitutaceae bacterium]
MKAIFLFNFAQFVDWPAEAFPAPDSPLIIGVLGNDPFGAFLDETLRDEHVGDHPVKLQRFSRVDNISICHILFISRSERNHLDEILATLSGRSILTVGDSGDFAVRGGMIACVTERNKVRLKINLEAARNAGLVLSSKLLRPAEIVAGGGI